MVAETREHLQHIVSEFERACDGTGLKINVGKSKVLKIKKDQMGSCKKVRVNGEEIQEVDKFNCLGVIICMDGGMGRNWLKGYLREESMWDDGKAVEEEHNSQRSKTGVT